MRPPVGLNLTLDLTYSDPFRRADVAHLALRTQQEILSVTFFLEDPVAVWNKIQQKFARRSEMGQEAA